MRKYLVAMIAFIIISIKKHHIHSYKIATLLFLVATINCIVWRIQKWSGSSFNMLSISYIVGAAVLLYLFWVMQDYVHVNSTTSPEPVVIEKVVYIAKEDREIEQNYPTEQVAFVLSKLEKNTRLTKTETKVLSMLLEGHTRKEISLKLSVSENTVKSHISHIYTKLEVDSKEELRALFTPKNAEA